MTFVNIRKNYIFIAGTLVLGVLCSPQPALAESGSAALGKVIDKGYHAARKMGPKANIAAIRAATKQESDHAQALLKQERFAFVKRFIRHNQSLTKTLINKIFKTGTGNTKLVQAIDGKPNDTNSARRPASPPPASSGPVGKAAGAKNVKFSAPSNLNPAVSPDGIIIDR